VSPMTANHQSFRPGIPASGSSGDPGVSSGLKPIGPQLEILEFLRTLALSRSGRRWRFPFGAPEPVVAAVGQANRRTVLALGLKPLKCWRRNNFESAAARVGAVAARHPDLVLVQPRCPQPTCGHAGYGSKANKPRPAPNARCWRCSPEMAQPLQIAIHAAATRRGKLAGTQAPAAEPGGTGPRPHSAAPERLQADLVAALAPKLRGRPFT